MGLKTRLKRILDQLPYFSGLYSDSLLYRKNACYPPGHFYSPIVSVDEIERDRQMIWKNEPLTIPGIDLRRDAQLSLLSYFERYYDELPFTHDKKSDLRYYFRNGYYSYTDGLILYSFLRHFKPETVIEVGSGFSSALMLDVNEVFFSNSVSLKFIEPFPDRLRSLLNKDNEKCEIIEKRVQEVPAVFFSNLEKNDILFIDSSHISKTGSDVNYLLFEVIPGLKPGVIIQFHDIFYPFEYPEEWVIEGRNWNEIYLVRAMLMNNTAFEILFFSQYIHTRAPEAFRNMILAYKDYGSNFWIRKVR